MRIKKRYYFFIPLWCMIVWSGFPLQGEQLDRGIRSAFNAINPLSIYQNCKPWLHRDLLDG